MNDLKAYRHVDKYKRYDKHDSDFFLSLNDSKLISQWRLLGTYQDDSNSEYMFKMFKDKFGFNVIKYSVKIIPFSHKTSPYDHAKLITIVLEDGTLLSKRFNNNQVWKCNIKYSSKPNVRVHNENMSCNTTTNKSTKTSKIDEVTCSKCKDLLRGFNREQV